MNLFTQIEQALSEIPDGWTSERKAQIMAGAVIALQPSISVEIGVWAGRGLIPVALAHKWIGRGMIYGIDPYSLKASVEGQVDPEHQKWWGNVDHEKFYKTAQDNIEKFGVKNHARLIRQTSDDFTPPTGISILRIDGNHGIQAARDIARYCPNVVIGGLLFLDDVDWAGSAILTAAKQLSKNGEWREIYDLDDGKVFQRIKL